MSMTHTVTSAAVAGRAMGSQTRLVVVGPDGSAAGDLEALAEHGTRRMATLEARWSRFLPDSDISRLNAGAGRAVRVHPDTVDLVTAMVHAWHATQGAFDPTLLGALVDLGYGASLEDPTRRSVLPGGTTWRGCPEAIEVDTEASAVLVPVGTALDPGGIGKGLAADLVVAELSASGAEGVLVSVGGDLRVAGRSPRAEGWVVAIDDPTGHTRPVASVRLLDGGVATSGTNRRRWDHGGVEVHHLVDPCTGSPASVTTADGRRVVGATVVAGTAAWAEAWTKTLMVGDTDSALSAVVRHGLAAMVVCEDGSTLTTSTWSAFAVDGFDDGSATRPVVADQGDGIR